MQVVVVFGVPYTPDFYKEAGGAIYIIFSLFPWDLLAKGFQDLGAAALGPSPGAQTRQIWSISEERCNFPFKLITMKKPIFGTIICVLASLNVRFCVNLTKRKDLHALMFV